jgi:ATP-dependent RNA helicase RhlE
MPNTFNRNRSSIRGVSTMNNRFNGPRRFNSSGRNHKRRSIRSIDPTLFVKKASPQIETEHYNVSNSFADFNFATPLSVNIANKGYVTPTPIQDQTIPAILDGRDVIGLANTGTGKTAAFLLPIIDAIFRNRGQKALIIAPTRELALQINQEFRDFTYGMHLHCATLIGGANIQRQIHDLRRNPDVVIATPGRLKDLIERRNIYLEDFDIFVLDEVDLMVDIGFIQDIRYFIPMLPKDRQSLFFSATLSPKLNTILQDFVHNPITVSVKVQDTSENIEQDVIMVKSRDQKIEQLHDLLIQDEFEKVLIFGTTKHGVDKLFKALDARGFRVGAIHGNKKQGHRQRTLQNFKDNHIQILLATDVASRGLDIDNVTHVINYEQPETYEDYIHRIGRTGRANKTGVALTFID